MAIPVHPLADEWTDQYSLFFVEHDRVTLSRPLRHFFADCRARMVRPVLTTGANATLSPHLYSAMVESGALWAFHDGQGWFNARSGERVLHVSELWTASPASERHPAMPADSFLVPSVLFDVYGGGRATRETTVGPLADHVVSCLGGGVLRRSGVDEPLADAWDHRSLTRTAQSQMPMSDALLGSSDEGAWASMTVARTRTGLIERVHGGVTLPQLSSVRRDELRDRVMPQITTMLTGLVENFQPRVALVSAGVLRHHDGMYGHRVGGQPVDAPLALLIGARAVRDLQLDLADVGRRHDVTMLGPGRVPSALVRLTGPDALWSQLHAFAFDLDQERLAAALAPTAGRMFS